MRAELLTPNVTAAPGQPIFVRMEVVNTSEVIDEIVLDAPDLDPSWITGTERRAALFPDGRVELSARIDLPEHYPAGQHDLVLTVSSAVAPDIAVTDVVQVEVAPITRAAISLHPAVLTGRRQGRFRAVVANQSNQELTLALDARDSLRVLGFDIEPRHLTVPPGAEAEATIVARGKQPWFGSPLARTITVAAQGAGAIDSNGAELVDTATFNQKARIPRGAVTALTLALILGVWVTAFTVGINRVLAKGTPSKDRPETFPLAQTKLDVAAVSGSITGTVHAGSTGKALPRITVEAYRKGRNGPVIAASAATTADGTFELAGLLPGTYLLRATAPGFQPTWSGGATDAGSAVPTKVTPATATEGINLTVNGNPGSITGTVLINAVAGTKATATLALVPVADGVRSEPLATVQTEPTGAFSFGGVPTPADYELVVTSTGFDQMVVPVSIRGGEDLVVNTIRLAAGPGQLGGVVSAGKGPLGGVTVTVADGAFRLTTVTPTSGQVGTWAVPNLPTPATYLVTFTLAGYGTQTVALDLGPGQTRGDVNVTLVGGSGSLSGRVVDSAGKPLGGVNVSVTGGTVKAATQTLTAGDVGSWRVLDVPAPGRYTITFSFPGFADETRVADLAATGGLTGLDVTLPRTSGSISGTVSSGGVPKGGIAVKVGNGTVVRTTESANSPAGAWLMNGLTPGTWTVTFSGAGYQDQTVLVTVAPGQDADVDADLIAK